MATEVPAPKEASTRIPTTLNLFRFPESELPGVIAKQQAALRFKTEFRVVESAYERFIGATEAKIDRLWDGETKENKRSYDLTRSAGCSAAYLMMSDELSAQGVFASDIFDFYQRCLNFEIRYSNFMERESRHTGTLNPNIGENRKGQLYIQGALEKEGKLQPAWFKGDKEEWKLFFENHANFKSYLEGFFQKYPQFPVIKDTVVDYFGIVSQDELPDWLDEVAGIPDRVIVEDELRAGLEEIIKASRQEQRARQQIDFFEEAEDVKFIKANRYLQKLRRENLAYPRNFVDAVIFLKNLQGHIDVTIDLSTNQNITPLEFNKGIIPAEKAEENRLKEISGSKDIISSKESIALWLERKLVEGGIISSTQALVDQDLVALIGGVFDEIVQGNPNSELQTLRNSRKKAHDVLRYDLKPLLETLNVAEIAYFIELMQASMGDRIEPIIWDLAEAISSKLQKNRQENLPKQTNIVIGHMQQFLKVWLKNNLTWATEALVLSLQDRSNGQTVEKQPVVENKEGLLPGTVSVEVQELEEATKELERDNLAGWHLYYTADRSLNPKSFVEIGDNLSPLKLREELFEQFVYKNKIPCKVPPRSIVDYFDNLVVSPPEEEWVKMRMVVNGVTFKKQRSPSGMRILYIMDPSKQEIIFFIHHKKAWGYRF